MGSRVNAERAKEHALMCGMESRRKTVSRLSQLCCLNRLWGEKALNWPLLCGPLHYWSLPHCLPKYPPEPKDRGWNKEIPSLFHSTGVCSCVKEWNKESGSFFTEEIKKCHNFLSLLSFQTCTTDLKLLFTGTPFLGLFESLFWVGSFQWISWMIPASFIKR